VVINRTLVYGSLTALLALLYLGGVKGTQAIFNTLSGQQEQPQLAIVVCTLIIAALFNPLRRRYPGLHRQALLSQEVRRKEDPGSFLGQAQGRDRPGSPQ
jgi:hypothetical protein